MVMSVEPPTDPVTLTDKHKVDTGSPGLVGINDIR